MVAEANILLILALLLYVCFTVSLVGFGAAYFFIYYFFGVLVGDLVVFLVALGVGDWVGDRVGDRVGLRTHRPDVPCLHCCGDGHSGTSGNGEDPSSIFGQSQKELLGSHMQSLKQVNGISRLRSL